MGTRFHSPIELQATGGPLSRADNSMSKEKVQTWKVGFDAAHKQEDNVCSTDDAIE
jgi:hypothetical protein